MALRKLVLRKIQGPLLARVPIQKVLILRVVLAEASPVRNSNEGQHLPVLPAAENVVFWLLAHLGLLTCAKPWSLLTSVSVRPCLASWLLCRPSDSSHIFV